MWSGRWDSNPRMSAWKADALPLGDARLQNHSTNLKMMGQAIMPAR
jgi:hypothetical protein